MSTRPIPTLTLALVLMLPVPCLGAESLGSWQARKVLKQAEGALEAGRWAEALDLYGRVIVGVSESNPRRAEALYGAALAEISRPEAERDLAMARQRLTSFFDAFPDHRLGTQAGALAALLDAEAATRRQAEERAEELQRKLLELDERASEPPVETAPDPAQASDELERTVQRLKRQLAGLRSELASTREELAKKDEAIERLKQVVLEGGG